MFSFVTKKYIMATSKYGRTLMTTLNDLFESPRLKIAVQSYDFDPQLLKALFLETCLETQQVVKNKMIKEYSTHSAFQAFQMIPYLRSINEFNKYNIYYSLSPLEQQLYLGTLDKKLTEEERKQLLEKIHKKFMQSNS
jgi:hypothetical protein